MGSHKSNSTVLASHWLTNTYVLLVGLYEGKWSILTGEVASLAYLQYISTNVHGDYNNDKVRSKPYINQLGGEYPSSWGGRGGREELRNRI